MILALLRLYCIVVVCQKKFINHLPCDLGASEAHEYSCCHGEMLLLELMLLLSGLACFIDHVFAM